MNKDFWRRIDRLEELAGKATQGEWDVYNFSKVFSVESGNNLFQAYSGFDSEGHKWDGKVNALYVAAAYPAMILEMIAEMRRLEKEADWLARRLVEFCDPDHDNQCCVLCRRNCNGVDCKEWREAARKAVEENK